MAYNDGPAEVDVNRGLVTSHDSLSEQLNVLAEDITALERRLEPVLREEKQKGDVLARALVDGISPLHAKAEQAVNEVRWLRARVQEIDSRVAL